MVNFRAVLKRFHTWCVQSEFLQFWIQKPTSRHCFEMLEWSWFFSGSHCEQLSKTKRILWIMTHFLTAFQFSTHLIQLFNAAQHGSLGELMWYFLAISASTVALLYCFVIRRYVEPLKAVRDFVLAQSTCSDDPDFDTAQRDQFSRVASRIIKAVLIYPFIALVVQLTPICPMDKLFDIPSVMKSYGPHVASVAHFLFHMEFAFIWLSKYFCSSGTFTVVFMGWMTELRISAKQFDAILCRARSSVEDKKFNTLHPFQRQRARKSFWTELQKDLSEALNQHYELLSNLQLIRPFISTSYFIRYYYSLYFIGVLLYAALREGSIWLIMMGLDVALSLLEVFWWTYLVESYLDVHDSIKDTVLELGLIAQHSAEHHEDYVKLRADVLIIANSITHGQLLSCGNVFDISMEMFVQLVNTSYSVLMFFIKMLK